MEDLTRTQMIMLVLLTSFVTSMATGIVTVSLMEQAPAPLTQTVHKVIEKIITAENSQQASPLFFASDEPTSEEKVISVINNVSSAVVSIIASKDLPVIEEYFVNPFEGEDFFGIFPDVQVPQYRQKGTEKRQISSGTGFFISKEGLLLTNKHVVEDAEAEYSIITNDGKKFATKVIARDPFQDIAILEIEKTESENEREDYSFNFITLGNSDNLVLGQSVIAIGNTLGEFNNTISVGVVSGLHRMVTAVGSLSDSEQLRDLIQTDAAINLGNSGGPLLDLDGMVVGINTAVAKSAENVGFALPINIAKRDINDAIEFGEIKYPFVGIRYKVVESGLLLTNGPNGESPVIKGGPADKAGLIAGDVIMELGGKKVTIDDSLSYVLSRYNVGDEIETKILRGEEEIMLKIILGERPDNL